MCNSAESENCGCTQGECDCVGKVSTKENKNIYACAMGVHLILDDVVYTADGEFILNAME